MRWHPRTKAILFHHYSQRITFPMLLSPFALIFLVLPRLLRMSMSGYPFWGRRWVTLSTKKSACSNVTANGYLRKRLKMVRMRMVRASLLHRWVWCLLAANTTFSKNMKLRIGDGSAKLFGTLHMSITPVWHCAPILKIHPSVDRLEPSCMRSCSRRNRNLWAKKIT